MKNSFAHLGIAPLRAAILLDFFALRIALFLMLQSFTQAATFSGFLARCLAAYCLAFSGFALYHFNLVALIRSGYFKQYLTLPFNLDFRAAALRSTSVLYVIPSKHLPVMLGPSTLSFAASYP